MCQIIQDNENSTGFRRMRLEKKEEKTTLIFTSSSEMKTSSISLFHEEYYLSFNTRTSMHLHSYCKLEIDGHILVAVCDFIIAECPETHIITINKLITQTFLNLIYIGNVYSSILAAHQLKYSHHFLYKLFQKLNRNTFISTTVHRSICNHTNRATQLRIVYFRAHLTTPLLLWTCRDRV